MKVERKSPSVTFSLIKFAEYTIMNIHEDGVCNMNRMYGFIGCGNMAGAIIGGMLSGGVCTPEQLTVYDISAEKSEKFGKQGANVAKDAEELVRRCDVVVLAVKPQVYGPVLESMKNAVDEKKILVSIAAGISTEYVMSAVGFPCKVVRAMPNTPLLLGYGATALSRCPSVTDSEFEEVSRLFSASGIVEVLPESSMNAVISVNGSSPAYVYLFAKAVIDSAAAQGIEREAAKRLIIQTIKGSAKMLDESGMEPDELIKMVTSPGGTTLAALNSFSDDDFEKVIDNAMMACTTRAGELAK